MVCTSFIVAALGALPLAFATSPAAYPPAPQAEGLKGDGPKLPGLGGPPGPDYAGAPPPDYQYNAPNATDVYQPPPPPDPAGPPGPPVMGKRKEVFMVAVGQNGLTFTPDTIHAKPGDEVVFHFSPKNHTVVRADFNDPCNPQKGKDLIFSGFNFAVANGTADKTFTIKVKDDKPHWLYCSQNQPMPHCGAGMVAVINPPPKGPNTLEAFKAAAAKTERASSPDVAVQGGEIKDLLDAPHPPPGAPAPEAPGAPYAPEAPSPPSAPTPPSTPTPSGAPAPPDAPSPPAAPSAPAAPDAPAAPSSPPAPGAPGAPLAPGAPSSTLVPGAPPAPGAPSSTLVPGAPLASGTGAPPLPSASPAGLPAQFDGGAATLTVSSALGAIAVLAPFFL